MINDFIICAKHILTFSVWGNLLTRTFINSEDLDEMQHNVTFHQTAVLPLVDVLGVFYAEKTQQDVQK